MAPFPIQEGLEQKIEMHSAPPNTRKLNELKRKHLKHLEKRLQDGELRALESI